MCFWNLKSSNSHCTEEFSPLLWLKSWFLWIWEPDTDCRKDLRASTWHPWYRNSIPVVIGSTLPSSRHAWQRGEWSVKSGFGSVLGRKTQSIVKRQDLEKEWVTWNRLLTTDSTHVYPWAPSHTFIETWQMDLFLWTETDTPFAVCLIFSSMGSKVISWR